MYRVLIEEHEEIRWLSDRIASDVEAVTQGIRLANTQMTSFERCRILKEGVASIVIYDFPRQISVRGKWSHDAIAKLYQMKSMFSFEADDDFFCTHGVPSVNSVIVRTLEPANAHDLLQDVALKSVKALRIYSFSRECLEVCRKIGIAQKILYTVLGGQEIAYTRPVKVSCDSDVFRCIYAESFLYL